jgi:predicted GNAT superfamily acetyltransferase
MTGYSDDRQFAYAASEERCILTHNRVDYERSHLIYIQTGQQHSGIIVTLQNNAYEIAQRVGIILNTLTADEVFNQLLYV